MDEKVKETVVMLSDRRPFNDNDFRGKITEDFDSKLIGPWKDMSSRWVYRSLTYLSIFKEKKGTLVIRVPGATRGCIDIGDDGIIKNITIYQSDRPCYKDISDVVKKYIGTKIICKGVDGNEIKI